MSKVTVYCSKVRAHKSGRNVFVGTFKLDDTGRWRLVPRSPAAGVIELVEWSQPLTEQEKRAKGLSHIDGPVFRHQIQGSGFFPYDRWRMECRQCKANLTLKDEHLQQFLSLRSGSGKKSLDIGA